jgi:hypothetical protein
MAFMGACTPAGLLALIALSTSSHIGLDNSVWLVLTAAGGVGGWLLARLLHG